MYIIKGVFLGILLSGILTTCVLEAFPESIHDIDYKYGNDINRFIKELNNNLELTDSNCMEVVDKIYNVLIGRQYADVYKLGVHGERGLKHALVKYNDRWGDSYLIFSYKIDGDLKLLNVPAGDTTLNTFFPSWNFYRIYSVDRRHWKTVYRKQL